MNATIEEMETVRTPFAEITPVVWRDGGMCGLASLHVRMCVGPIGWLIANAITKAL